MTSLTSLPLPELVVTALAAIAVSGCTVDLGDDTTRRVEERSVAVDDATGRERRDRRRRGAPDR